MKPEEIIELSGVYAKKSREIIDYVKTNLSSTALFSGGYNCDHYDRTFLDVPLNELKQEAEIGGYLNVSVCDVFEYINTSIRFQDIIHLGYSRTKKTYEEISILPRGYYGESISMSGGRVIDKKSRTYQASFTYGYGLGVSYKIKQLHVGFQEKDFHSKIYCRDNNFEDFVSVLRDEDREVFLRDWGR